MSLGAFALPPQAEVSLVSPTVLPEFYKAQELFSNAYSYPSKIHDTSDNCFNRAHFWSRAFEVAEGIKTAKVFLIKSKVLSQQGRLKWWYHVAPAVAVQEEDDWVMMDLTYTNEPTRLMDWLENFVGKENASQCIRIKKLSDYNRESSTPCAIMISNMYHRVPTDPGKEYAFSQWHCTDLKAVTKEIDAPSYYEWNDLESFYPGRCLGYESDSVKIQELIKLSEAPKVANECEERIMNWVHYFSSERQKKMLATVACEDNSNPPDEVAGCMDKAFYWVNRESNAKHRRLISAIACRGGTKSEEVTKCLQAVYDWTSSNADIYHRREIAAIACGYGSNPEKIVECLKTNWPSNGGTNFDKIRISVAEKCQGTK